MVVQQLCPVPATPGPVGEVVARAKLRLPWPPSEDLLAVKVVPVLVRDERARRIPLVDLVTRLEPVEVALGLLALGKAIALLHRRGWLLGWWQLLFRGLGLAISGISG